LLLPPLLPGCGAAFFSARLEADALLRESRPMFARLGKFLGRALGKVLYWIGWGVAILLIAQAIILAIASGNALAPMLLGAVGVIVWLVVIGFKYITHLDFESIGRRVAFWYTAALVAVLCVVAFYFDFSQLTSDGGRPSLSLGFSWAGIPACASISPAFELGGVPAGTKRLSFLMTDLDVPTFHHGGSTVAYQNNVVSRGAVRYTGPCPPRGQHHNYRWTVQALDAAGNVLGTGSAEAMFPP
jgi:hypothetical protein